MTYEITVRQLRYFLMLGDELHFGRAAMRLGIAQPALSQQLRVLEAAIGSPLIRRRPSVALTPAGEALLSEARQSLARFDLGIARARLVASGDAGPLAIGFAASAVLTHLPELIQRYRRDHPNVHLDLRVLTPAEEREAVSVGMVDVAFVREIAPDPYVRYVPVVKERFAVLLPRRHPLAPRTRVRAEQLAGEPFVHFPRDVAPSLHDQIDALCIGAGFSPHVVQETREWLTEISLVQAGVGVAIVPDSIRGLRLGRVLLRPIVGSRVTTTIHLCMRRDGISQAARLFAEMAIP